MADADIPKCFKKHPIASRLYPPQYKYAQPSFNCLSMTIANNGIYDVINKEHSAKFLSPLLYLAFIRSNHCEYVIVLIFTYLQTIIYLTIIFLLIS